MGGTAVFIATSRIQEIRSESQASLINKRIGSHVEQRNFGGKYSNILNNQNIFYHYPFKEQLLFYVHIRKERLLSNFVTF
jgi:hypothetical protein